MKKLDLPKTVVVDRSKWDRGRGVTEESLDPIGNVRLYSPRNKKFQMCCLGFACHQAGVSKQDIKGKTAPDDIDGFRVKSLVDRQGFSTYSCQILMETNDDTRINDEQREEKLNKIAKRIGFKFEFIN